MSDLSAAGEFRDELRATAELLGTRPLLGGVCRADGHLALAGGDANVARSRFEEAAEILDAAGLPYETGLARIELSQALIALGSLAVAADEARVAKDLLDSIGAERAAERAAAILERARSAGTSGRASTAAPWRGTHR